MLLNVIEMKAQELTKLAKLRSTLIFCAKLESLASNFVVQSFHLNNRMMS